MDAARETRPARTRRPGTRPVEHLTRDERAARGKAARAAVPRESLGAWAAAAGRKDPVDVLEEQSAARVADLVPIRYGRMLVSPFTFYRGAAALMAADLAGSPRTGLRVQLCGDAHLSNFGVFAAPDRRLVFGVNDFDETLPGPFEWDLKRLAASFAVAGRDRGLSTRQRREVCVGGMRTYRATMRHLAAMRTLDLWYAGIDVDQITALVKAHESAKQARRYKKGIAKARAKDSLRAFSKLTHVVDGEVRIVSDPPVIVPIEELAGVDADALDDFVHGALRDFERSLPRDRRSLVERYRYVHAARKVVGVGSVGTRAWVALLLGCDDDDPLFLQLKEADASVLEPFLGTSEFESHGQRVVEGQRLMQTASDVMLGWNRVTGVDGVARDYYMRQLWDQKGSADIELMNRQALASYAALCGSALAHSHARSGDAVAIASYMGGGDAFAGALADFAEAYADQNERDYGALKQAVSSGRITETSGL